MKFSSVLTFQSLELLEKLRVIKGRGGREPRLWAGGIGYAVDEVNPIASVEEILDHLQFYFRSSVAYSEVPRNEARLEQYFANDDALRDWLNSLRGVLDAGLICFAQVDEQRRIQDEELKRQIIGGLQPSKSPSPPSPRSTQYHPPI